MYTQSFLSTFDDYKTFQACDMEWADIDGARDLDIVGRIGRPEDDVYGVNCWFENPGRGGTTWQRHDIGTTEYVKDIEVDDFSRDSRPDVVVRTHAVIDICLQNRITDPGFLGCVLISSEDEKTTMDELIGEFKIELLDDYMTRALAHRHTTGNME